MEQLIKALNIFLKYGNPKYPTHCEHDVLYVSIDPKMVNDEDKQILEWLGFTPSRSVPEVFESFRYGSA